MYFIDRHDAGKKLSLELKKYEAQKNVIVLSIPRGGVVIGYEIAKALRVPLDVVTTKKIGAPDNPEFAIGAVNLDGDVFLDEQVVELYGITKNYIEDQVKILRQAMTQKEKLLRGDKKYPDLKDKVVILNDDGIATGHTMLAAIEFVRKRSPKVIIVAVPVAASDSLKQMKLQVDEFICLYTPDFFGAVGNFYQNFQQTEDSQAKELLKEIDQSIPK